MGDAQTPRERACARAQPRRRARRRQTPQPPLRRRNAQVGGLRPGDGSLRGGVLGGDRSSAARRHAEACCAELPVPGRREGGIRVRRGRVEPRVFHEPSPRRADANAKSTKSRRAKRGETPRSTEPLVRHHEREETKMDRRKSREEAASRAAPRGRGRGVSAIRRRRGAAPLGTARRGRFSQESRTGAAARAGPAREAERRRRGGVRVRREAFAAADRTTVRDAQAAPADAASHHRAGGASEATGTRAEVSSGHGKTNAPPPCAGAAASLRASSRRCANGSPGDVGRRRRTTPRRSSRRRRRSTL